MESLPNGNKSLPTPPLYIVSGGVAEQNVRVYQINSSHSLPPSLTATENSKEMIVGYEVELRRAPGLTTRSFCQILVTTEVTFQVGTFAWLMCFLLVLCGLILGCCLIPFFVNHFKEVYHS